MANRRCFHRLATRLYTTSIYSNSSLQTQYPNLQSLIPQSQPNPLQSVTPKFPHISPNFNPTQFPISRHFSSNQRDDSDDGDESEDDDDDGEEWEDDDDDENVGPASSCGVDREYTGEERENEAAAIGYKVIGRLDGSELVFKEYEPVFAVIQIGSHQFKVSNGDCIYTEKLKFCDVNDKLILNKVLMLGSRTKTMIGRPVLPDASVHAVVEEHALDAKVIVFKKKRRKNYRRKNGHRQELTKLRITDIQGIEKPEKPTPAKTEKSAAKKAEKVAVPA